MKVTFRNFSSELTEYQLAQYAEDLNLLILEIEKKLELNLLILEELVCTDQMSDDVIDFQKSKGLRAEISERCGGKVIFYNSNGELKATVFFLAGLALGLSTENNFPIKMLIHELSHVHEEYYTSLIYDREIFSDSNHRKNFKSLSYILKKLSNIVWAEYFAVAVASCVSSYNMSNVREWMGEVNDNIQKIKELLQQYSVLKEIDNYYFFARLQEYTNVIFIRFTYIGGDINYREDKDDIYKKEIEKSDLSLIFNKAINELNRLFEKHPNWCGVEEYEALSNIMLEFWRILGIDISDDGSDVTIDVCEV